MVQAVQPAPEVAWTPNKGPQTAAILCPVEDLFYGGARGGGKSSFLLGHNAIRADGLGASYRGLLARRTLIQLGELMEEAAVLYPKLGAQWEAQHKTWRFPKGGYLRMRYLESAADAAEYQGHAYTDISVDEVGNYADPTAIDLLRAALRTTDPTVTCLLRLTGNPGGPGHEWLKSRYVTPAKPMTPFTAAIDEVTRVTRVFIPSFLTDNPKIANPAKYEANIRASGPPWLVKAWLHGDWSGPPKGGLLNPDHIQLVDDDPKQLVRKLGLHPVIYWDFAASEKQLLKDDPDYSACVVVARDDLGRFWILDAWRGQVDSAKVAQQIVAMQRKWKERVKGEKGALEKMIQPVLRIICQQLGYQVALEPISKGPIDKVAHSMAYQMLLGSRSVYACRGQPWLADLMHEHATFPSIGKGIHDDWIDALSYGAQDVQGQRVGTPPLFPDGVTKFHPDTTHEVMERLEEERKRLAEEDAGDDGRESFW